MSADRDKEKAVSAMLRAEELLERCGANELKDADTEKHVQLIANELANNRAVVFDKDPTYIDENLKTSYIRALTEENLVIISQMDALNARIDALTHTVEALAAIVEQISSATPAARRTAPKHAAKTKKDSEKKNLAEKHARDPFTENRDSDEPRPADVGW